MAGLRRAPHRRLLRSLRRRQLFLESLEDRRLLSVFTVNSTDDEPDWFPGDGQALTAKKTTTLRAAIMEANARAGKDTIEFNISGAGPHVIKLATRLPAIIDPISIDGYTQPGARPNSQTLRDGHDAVVKIELDGSRLPIGTNGLDIVGGQSEVMGLAIHSFYGRPIAHQEYLGTTIVGEGGMGIWLWGGSGSQIVGNFLGATAAGQLPTYPRPADAISTGVVAGSADNVIQENLVVGHSGAGIALGAKIATELAENVRGNRVVGNYVGLLQDGQTPRGNSTGVLICWGAFGNYIGGDEARLGNLISGNTGVGISIVGVAPENKYVGGNVIQRNLIGTDRTGTSIDRDGQASSGDETGNRYAGIQIDRSPGNVVGGAFVSAGNVISGNLAGVTIFEPPSSGNQISHNKVGTDLTGSIALPNTLNGIQIQRSSQNEISGNVIAGNLGTGVYVEGPAASGNRIQDNLIGVDSTGSTGLGNGNGGIDILHASANTIQRNTISGSPNYGIGVTILGVTATQNVVTKNRIGTDAAGLRAVGNTGMGVAIVDASENTLSDNVISGNEMDGVLIRGVTARVNAVTGNLIGLNADGNAALSNHGAGIYIDGAPENAIGRETPESGNVISGNAREGVKIVGPLARGNEVLNNYIGTDHDGHGAGLGNALGVLIENAAENRVGALDLGHNMGNVIAGNYGDGVLIRNTQKTFLPDAVDNKIQVNWIGLDADQAPLPNRGAGVRIVNAAGTIVGSEPIGATGEIPDDNAGNIIAHNHSDGVRVEGPYTQGNSIRGNSIYANEQLGINLVGGREVVRKPIDGVTPNDDDDSDDGPNRLMNFPVGVTAVYDPRNDTTYISGVLAAAHPDQAMVDVYANAARDASGFGEGQLYVGSATPNPSGVFHLTRSGKLPAPYLSAAATDGGGRGSTSEFSPVCDIDSDGDGLPDDWEKKGIDFNGDGRVDLDLPKLGARPDHRDLFVEFDYLEGFAPSDMSITLVQSAFHHAPVPNPDGTSGIDLHVNRVSDADRIPFVAGQTEKTRVTGTGPGASDDWWDLQRQYYGTAAERAQADQWPSIRGARGLVFRHCIFLRDLFESSGSSGYGKIHGDSFIVSLGSWDVSYLNRYGGRAVVEAGTFMHELGHTLGLHHGGPVPAGYVGDVPYGDTQTNYKPNYLSVMNYSFQDMRYTVRPLDYSTVQLPSLDESKLLERDGINGQSWYPQLDRWTHTVYTDIWTGTSYFHKVPSQQGIDWNRSLGPLDTGHVGGYINDPSAAAAWQDTLDSYRDWPSLRYSFRYSKTGFRGLAGATEIPSPPPGLFHAEPTDQEIFDTLLRADSDEDGVVNAYDNVPQVPNPDQTDSDGNGIGDAGELLSVVLDRNSVAAGQNVTGTITALVPAPAGGLRVFLWTSDAGIVEAPESVIIPAGQRSATFTLRTLPELATSATVDVYAHYWGEALHTQLLVGPPLPQADLEIEQTAAPVPVGVGGDLTYSITVTNHGPTAATGVTITDLLPANADLVSVTAMRTLPPPANEPLHVRFDYSFDWSGFFDTDEKKALLDLAADLVLADIRDNLRPIRPSGTNTWTAIFTHPTTGEEVEYPDLTIEANELVVFVGARDLGYTLSGMLEGGEGVIGGSSADGTAEFVRTVSTRGERAAPYDVAPWGGSIAFTTDPSVTFHYGVDTVDLDPDELDFLTVAVHELYHVLGFGTSPAWDSHIEWDTDLWDRAFVGSQARQEYDAGGPVPLDPGRQHWREGTTDQGAAALMDPYIERGRRELPTRLDAAALADLGWGDAPCSTQVPLPYTYAAGTVVFDADGLAPGESLTLQIVVMPTVEGSVTNQLSVAGDGTDPDSSNNTSTLTTDVLPCPPLVVNTTRDLDDRISDGRLTSLREAIRLANLLPGRDFISFEIPDFGSVSYISVYSPLPTITDPVVIDGTTQPGFVDAPVINLGAPFRQGGFNGLHITAGNSEVRGLWISGFGYQTLDLPRTILRGNGILLEDGGGNIIEGNYLGAATAYSLGNETAGIMLINSDGNRIGGTTPESRNVIAGNYNWGILAYDSHHNIIEGNYIGTDPSGQLPAGNGVGLSLSVADDNQIGGTQPGAGNVISGNRGVGIEVSQNYLFTNASRTRIEGNWIGTAADGTGSLGNGSHGIAIWLGNHDNVIGGRDLAAANTIAFNGGAGVLYGSSNTNTLILGNSIHSNAGLAIDRWPIGVDANSQYYWFYPSPDYPELAYAVSDTAATRIRGTMKGLPNTSCQLDFYFSASADPSGHGEGQQWLGLATVTTDAYGIAPFYVSFPQGVPAGHFIAATSTVTETSEFSNSVPVRADRDGDGVPDAEENGGPNLGDADHDGNPDSDEANVATFLVFGGGQHLTLQSPPATQLSGICSIANPAPGSSPYATPFPLGFIDGTIEDVPPGGAVTVTLLLPAAFEPHGFYQFGMLAGASENNWYEFLDDGVTGAEVFADRIVLHYVDGGRGDHDLAADGRIMFRGGVSAPAAMYVLEVSPAANENTVSAATSISATFASQVDPATVSDLTFVVHASQSGQLVVPPSALTVDRATVTFDGAPLFHPGELVNVTATRGIENTSGESPPSPFAWQFRAAALGGTGVFAESDQRFGIPDTYGVAMQDLDGDGDIDIFFANGAPEPSTVMLNDGHGVFADSGQQLGPFDARDVALGDVDGDGDLDAFLATLQGGNHVWLNDGHAVFTDSGQQLGTAGTWGVRLGDLDGDGDLDAFCATEAGQPNNVWINDGQGRFADSGQRLGAADSRDVALGDVDHDGDLDAFVANFDGGNQVWVNNGQGVFADSDQRLGAPGNRAVALGDLDGDGDLDAYTASAGWDTVWFNDGQGRFTASNQYLQSDGMTIDLDDFDADGDLDALALTHSASGYGDLWLNDGFGRFQASGRGAQFIGAATTTGGQALGDVDGDGDADAVLANLTPGWFGRTMLLINEGAGVIGWSNATSNYLGHSGQELWSTSMADLDRDGDLDIFFGGSAEEASLVWFNDGQGRFIPGGPRPGRPDLSQLKANLGDLDGDGDLDAVVWYVGGFGYPTYWNVWLNDGHGRFADSGQERVLVREQHRITLGDVDGDGDLDAIVVGGGWHTTSNEIWLNDGLGNFTKTSAVLGTALDGTKDIALGDIDGDGDLDAFLANSETAIIDDSRNTIWLNDGQGNFSDSGQRLGHTHDACDRVRLADMDEDGDLDAVVATIVFQWNHWQGWIPAIHRYEVWLNDGQGHFSDSGQRLAAGPVGEYLVNPFELADLDGDGDLDVFSGDRVWLNDGRARFSDSGQALGDWVHLWFRPYWPRDVSVGDADGDGDLDAVVLYQHRPALWLNQDPDQINYSPNAAADGFSVPQGTVLDVPSPGVLANDVDPEDEPLTAELVVAPLYAMHFELHDDGSFTYTPHPDYFGPDRFEYAAVDPLGHASRAVVSIFLLPGRAAPVAEDDVVTTQQERAVTVNVLANDRDRSGPLDPQTIVLLSAPANGRATLDLQTGMVAYEPQQDFVGSDSFTYRITGATGLRDDATVTIHVLAGPRPPRAAPDAAKTDEDTPVVVDVVTNDIDPDGDLDRTTVVIVVSPTHGLVQVDASSGTVTYTPSADFFGTDRFVYTVSDRQSASSRAVVDISVLPRDDAPQAADDFAHTDQDVPVVIDVLANDADADGDLDVRSVSVVELPLHGATEVDPDTGAITYSPAAGFRGLDSCVYEVRDAAGQAATATVRIEVRPTSHPPRATADAAETPEDTPVTIDVAANDTDPDGDLDPGSVRILVQPLHGGAVVVPETGQIVFTPPADFSGVALLWYEIRDALDQPDTGLVQVTVTPVNDPPVAGEDAALTRLDTPIDVHVLTNDRDSDSRLDPASLRIDTGPASGTVVLQPDGSVRYTPRAGFIGTDTFRYAIADDVGARSNVATVTLTVQAEPAMLIVGRVCEDLDGTGPSLAGPGVAGVAIYLLDGQGQLLATALTQADDLVTPEDETGWYHFPDLPTGTYIVAQKRMTGWSQSYPHATGLELADPPVQPGMHVVTLSQLAEPAVLDFGVFRSGEAGLASVAGRVYVDVNNNGLCDPQEMGLPNVPITISGPVTRVTYTRDDGSYGFEDLPAGDYTIVETQPLLFQDGRDTPGTPHTGSCDDDRFENLALMPDMALMDYNFGEFGLKSQFISKQLLLASTPPSRVFLGQLQVATGDSLLLLAVPADGTLRAATTSEGEPPAVQLYDEHWRPLALAAPGGTLRTPVTAGQHLLMYVHAGSAATVDVTLDAGPPPSPAYVHTNRARIHDVNDDGVVSPRDVLLVINTLNATGSRQLPKINLGTYYLDVNADTYLSPRDALLIINTLNQIADLGEGEQTAAVRDRALWEFLAETEEAAADALDALLDSP